MRFSGGPITVNDDERPFPIFLSPKCQPAPIKAEGHIAKTIVSTSQASGSLLVVQNQHSDTVSFHLIYQRRGIRAEPHRTNPLELAAFLSVQHEDITLGATAPRRHNARYLH